MQTYFSTFVAGAEPLIEKALKKRPKDKLKLLDMFPGLIVYDADYAVRDLRNWGFFNNTFALIRAYELKGENLVRKLVREIENDKGVKRAISKVVPIRGRGKTPIKLVVMRENKEETTREPFINKFEKFLTSVKGIEINPHKAEYELWLYIHKDPSPSNPDRCHGMFGLRLTQPDPNRRKIRPGELRPELAHLLALASEPSPKDVVLDPFAGRGAIPIARAKNFPYKQVIAADGGKVQVDELKKSVQRARKKIKVLENDSFSFPLVKDKTIDKIITDPPWGKYKQFKTPREVLYKEMLAEFDRVLKPRGMAVVLMGAMEQFEEALNTGPNKATFRVLAKYPILVSGHKANIYKLSKEH